MTAALRLLTVAAPAALTATPWGPFDAEVCGSLEAAGARLREQTPDALLLGGGDAGAWLAWGALSHAVLDTAVVALADVPPAQAALLLQRGVQDVLPAAAGAADIARALHLAVERKRLEQAARKAYATDLATGLPNRAQLNEHLAHLFALREREPAPMALVVLRVEGLARTAAELGAEAANVLRRKAAVRLRAGLRASDVVAALGDDSFAVLLAWMDAPGAGERVAAKLAQSLAEPFGVAGRPQALAVSVGLASYPEHGRDAEALLRRALGQAAQAPTVGGAAAGRPADRGPHAAANDDEA
jgi:diguanylate cyclase